MPRNPDKGAAVANPTFMHYVDMNQNGSGGSDDEIDIDEEIDIDVRYKSSACSRKSKKITSSNLLTSHTLHPSATI